MEIFKFSNEEREVLIELGLSALVLFGSRALGLAKEKSDYDIGVLLFPPVLEKNKRSKIYDVLYGMLSRHVQNLVNIDIVFLDTAPGELRAQVMKHGQVIFEADKAAFANFKERVMREYADFSPIREMFHKAILARIP